MQLKTNPPEILNRYTSLPILLDILTRREIFLLNPATWEDGNDRIYVEEYRLKKKLEAVLAICFTTRPHTFHHWKIFSGGVGGVCIQFDKLKFLQHVRKVHGTLFKTVTYKTVNELRQQSPDLKEWPFLKRWPYRDEEEFRVIYETRDPDEQLKGISFDLGCIRRITLSPWLPFSVFKTVKMMIKTINGCEKLPIYRSTLLNNADWRAAIRRKHKV